MKTVDIRSAESLNHDQIPHLYAIRQYECVGQFLIDLRICSPYSYRKIFTKVVHVSDGFGVNHSLVFVLSVVDERWSLNSNDQMLELPSSASF